MTLRQLYDNTPLELKKILFNQWQAKQNPKWHPEGNTLKHIVVVTKRAIDKFSNDIDLILSDLDKIRFIVKNHMRHKNLDQMRDAKRERFMNEPYFSDLEKFGTIDKGGLFESMDTMSKNLYDKSDNDYRHMIGKRVEFQARGKKWVGIAEFIGINPLHNQFQVTVDRTPIWPVTPNTIKLSSMRPKMFP